MVPKRISIQGLRYHPYFDYAVLRLRALSITKTQYDFLLKFPGIIHKIGTIHNEVVNRYNKEI